MLPIADGNDLGGSLRNPANFNNVVALRPTVGLVPTAPDPFPGLGFNVNGPLARSVSDLAFLMSVMAGPDPRDPACFQSDASVFAHALGRDFRNTRVAWCLDLGGLPVDRRVRQVLEPQRTTFETLGCIVEDACPDLAGADSNLPDDSRMANGCRPRPSPQRSSSSDEAGSDRRDRSRSVPSAATRSSRQSVGTVISSNGFDDSRSATSSSSAW